MKKSLILLIAIALAVAIYFAWTPASGPAPVAPPPASAGPEPLAVGTGSETLAAPDGPTRSAAPRRAVIPDGSAAFRIAGTLTRVATVPIVGARVQVFEHKTNTATADVPGAQMWRGWMADLVQLDADAGLVAEGEVGADGAFAIDAVRGVPGSQLALTLAHDLYGMVSPRTFSLPTAPGAAMDLGELETYLGAFVFGRLVGFGNVAGTEVRLACEADQMAPMRDPGLFRLQIMGFERLVQTVGADGRFAFRAVPQTAHARVLATGAGEMAFGNPMALLPGERREVLVLGHPAPTVTIAATTAAGTPIEGANVQLLPRTITGTMARTLATRRASTDGAGRAALAAVGPGTWFARVTSDGLAPASREIEVIGAADQVFEFSLGEGGVVAGRVIDADGKPIENAGVDHQPSLDVPFLGNLATQYGAEQFAAGALRSTRRTDADGGFRLTGLTYEEEFTLAVAHPDYLATLTDARVGADDLAIVLMRGARLRATILDGRDGKPVTQFTATLLRKVMGMMEMPARTITVADAEGALTMSKLPPGSLALRIEAAGLARHEQDVRLRDDETLDLGDLRLTPPAQIQGRVVDDRGQPVARAKVRALRGGVQDNEMFVAMTGAKAAAQTASDGTFTLDDLVPGRVRLQASARCFAPTQSERVAVEASQTLRDVVLTLGHGGAIAGRILFPVGADPTRWQVIAGEIRGADIGQVEPKPDGSFRIENLLGGRYNLQAMDVLAMSAANEEFAGGLVEGRGMDLGKMMQSVMRTTVQTRCLVKDGETTEVELDARSLAADGARLTVEVLVGDEPLTDGFAEVTPAGSSATQMAVLVDGSFVVEGVSAGTLLVQIRQGMGMAPIGEPTRIEMPRGGSDHRTTLRLAGGRLSGRVVHDATGDPLAGALIRVRGAHAATDREPDVGFAMTDPQGRFSLAGLAEGSYSLVADDGLGPERGRAGGRLEDVQLAAGQHRDDLVLRARPAAGVSVRVIDENGVGISRAMVIATDREGTAVGSRSVTFADGEGRATLAGLPAGTIRIAARGSHHAPGVSDAREVAPGTEVEFVVRLAHGTPVEVTVAGTDGRPWPDAMVAIKIGAGPWIPASLLQTTRSASGAIDLGQLPPGVVAFRVFGAGAGSFEVRRTVPAGRRVGLVLTPDVR